MHPPPPTTVVGQNVKISRYIQKFNKRNFRGGWWVKSPPAAVLPGVYYL